ncbi:MAG: hypothetical protein DRO39_05560 [Thermoprotei archaeon]|nr:MAG: hypothetical protein DRO39_05560 [Thermoprotei archaeon]
MDVQGFPAVCTEAILLPRRVVRRLREAAERQGMSLEEYLLEVLSQGLDPRDRAREYAEAAEELLERAREELRKGDVRQAAEKAWGAAALVVKAYALWREGRRLSSHGELWEYSRKLMDELGGWVSDAWAQASAMHVCFYEGWCTDRHVEEALKRIERLVKSVEERVRAEDTG